MDFPRKSSWILGIQMAQCRSYLQILGPNVGIVCILGSLGMCLQASLKVIYLKLEGVRGCPLRAWARPLQIGGLLAGVGAIRGIGLGRGCYRC